MRRVFTDMLQRQVTVNYPPKRVVSVVPSQTELLFDLGLDEEVAGITKFCIHPVDWYRNKQRVGGTKKLNIDKIISLQPDLIIANKEENTQAQIEELATRFPIWISDIQTVKDAIEMIKAVGTLTGTEEKANNIARDIANGFNFLQKDQHTKRVAYFIWRAPWMCAGGDTFINDMIERTGWTNVFADQMRYPEVTTETLAKANPDIVLLSSEPFPFQDKHIAEIKAVLPDARLILVDGEMFSWYGSRLLKAVSYLDHLVVSL